MRYTSPKIWPFCESPGLALLESRVENSTSILQFSCGVIAIARYSALINVTRNQVAGNIHLLN